MIVLHILFFHQACNDFLKFVCISCTPWYFLVIMEFCWDNPNSAVWEWKITFLIYSQAKTGSWALNNSLETADKNLWGLLLFCGTESHWNNFLYGKLSCEQDTTAFYPSPARRVSTFLMKAWWIPCVIYVYFDNTCIWVKTGAVE